MLKQRVITGVILALLVSFAIFFLPNLVFDQLALLIIVGIGTWEWAGLTGLSAKPSRWLEVASNLGLAELFFLFEPSMLLILLISLAVWVLILYLLRSYQQQCSFLLGMH